MQHAGTAGAEFSATKAAAAAGQHREKTSSSEAKRGLAGAGVLPP